MMQAPPRWTDAQLTAGAAVSRRLFRDERLKEPLERWKTAFAQHEGQFQQLFDKFGTGRFLWGSDAPNVERYCTYAQSLTYFTRHADYLGEAERRAILRDNAIALIPALAPEGG